jgi:archaemetzincin
VSFRSPRSIAGAVSLEVRPFGGVRGEAVAGLTRELADRLAIPARILPTAAIDPEWGIGPHGQVLAGAVLDRLIADSTPGRWSLGVVDADLGAPGRDFVFGEATVGGCCAVIGLHRLGSPAAEVASRRLLAEALHELGHVAGLTHCCEVSCVMYPAVRPEDVDRRGLEYCTGCRSPGRGP